MNMKLIELSVLVCFFSFFILFKRVDHVDMKDHRVEKTRPVVIREEVLPEPPLEQNYVQEIRPIQSKTISSRTEEIEIMWMDNLHDYLTVSDPENADEIYAIYLKEVDSHEEDLKTNLATNLDQLSTMNGESISTVGDSVPPYELERLHQTRVKRILGANYEYVREREQIDRDDSGF